MTATTLLTRREAAAYLGISEGTLSVWACTGRYQVPYLKVGRSVKYRQADLDRWLESRAVNPCEPVREVAAV